MIGAQVPDAGSMVTQQMRETLAALVARLIDAKLAAASVIPWSSPVPAFGDATVAEVATLGLNPSNREFLNGSGDELVGPSRRLHTLSSLGLASWGEAKVEHLETILASCCQYFSRNPYDIWFRELDRIISGTNTSYYNQTARACHLDLIPYATACKWTELVPKQRSLLLELTGDALGLILRESRIRLLILNGVSVVENLQRIARVRFHTQVMPRWKLSRRTTSHVAGVAYRGTITEIAGVQLGRPVSVLGFNHNIQSSFGVTLRVKEAIGEWVAEAAREVVT